jgi:hypothetical protein
LDQNQWHVNRLPFCLSLLASLSFRDAMGSSWSYDIGAMCCGRQRQEAVPDSEETKKWDAWQLSLGSYFSII